MLVAAEARLGGAVRRIATSGAAGTAAAERRMEVVTARTRALDPALTLARGWSITRRPDGTLVRTVSELQPGDEVVTTLVDGVARSRVEAAVEEAGA